VASLEQRPHRGPQRGPPQVARDPQGFCEASERQDLAVHAGDVARGEQIEDASATGREQRGRRPGGTGPCEQLLRTPHLVIEARLADDERIVRDGGGGSERERVAEALRAIDRRPSQVDRPVGLVGEVELGRQSRLEEDRRDGVLGRLRGDRPREEAPGERIVGAVGDAEVCARVGVPQRRTGQERRVLRQVGR
jgi:hypothetical protein